MWCFCLIPVRSCWFWTGWRQESDFWLLPERRELQSSSLEKTSIKYKGLNWTNYESMCENKGLWRQHHCSELIWVKLLLEGTFPFSLLIKFLSESMRIEQVNVQRIQRGVDVLTTQTQDVKLEEHKDLRMIKKNTSEDVNLSSELLVDRAVWRSCNNNTDLCTAGFIHVRPPAAPFFICESQTPENVQTLFYIIWNILTL